MIPMKNNERQMNIPGHTIPLHAMEIFLQPGELWFGNEETRIRTILGSCVAVTLWHPAQRIGGMCHFMLPRRPRHGTTSTTGRDGRYGDEALEMLADELRSAGTHPEEYQAKLFGGGRMFTAAGSSLPVPDQNVAAARALASRHGFKVVAEHLGGHGHRHVALDLWCGHTWLRHTPLQPPQELSQKPVAAQICAA